MINRNRAILLSTLVATALLALSLLPEHSTSTPKQLRPTEQPASSKRPVAPLPSSIATSTAEPISSFPEQWNTVATNATEPEPQDPRPARRARFLRCFKGSSPTRILMVGDSHVRYYFEAMCRALGFAPEHCVRGGGRLLSFDDIEDGLDVRIQYISSPLFNFRGDYAFEEIRSFREAHSNVTAIFFGRGAWDVLFNNTDLEDLLLDTHRAAGELRRAFPEATMFGMVPHYFHLPPTPHYRPCVAESRILKLRQAFAEGVMLGQLDHVAQQDDHITTFDPQKTENPNEETAAMKDNTTSFRKRDGRKKKHKRHRQTSPVPKPRHPSKMFLVDTFCFTKQLAAYTDRWGHHYSDDVVLPVLADIVAHPAIARGAAPACRDAIFSGGPTKAATLFELPISSSAHEDSWWRSGTPKPLDIFVGKTAAEKQQWFSHLKFGGAAPLEETATGQRAFKIFSHHNGSNFTACKESAEATWRTRWNSVVASLGGALRSTETRTDFGSASDKRQKDDSTAPYLERRSRVQGSVALWMNRTDGSDSHHRLLRSTCACNRLPFFESCPLFKPLWLVEETWGSNRKDHVTRVSIATHYCKLSQKLKRHRAAVTEHHVETVDNLLPNGFDDPMHLTLLNTSAINTDARYWDHFLAMICTAEPRKIGQCMLNIGGDALLHAWMPPSKDLRIGPRSLSKRLRFLSDHADGLTSASAAAMNMVRVTDREPASWCNFTAMNRVLGLENRPRDLDGGNEAVRKARSRFFHQLLKPGVGCPATDRDCRV